MVMQSQTGNAMPNSDDVDKNTIADRQTTQYFSQNGIKSPNTMAGR